MEVERKMFDRQSNDAILVVNRPAISIVVCVYNVKPYLAECLDSLLGQTFKAIEIVCVDDGSTDGSSETLDVYQKKDTRLNVIHLSKNRGSGYARKIGVEHAKGGYIMFCDSDDTFKANACQCVYEEIQAERTDIIQFETEIVWCGEHSASEKKGLINVLKPYYKTFSGDLCTACFKEKKWSYTMWNKAYDAEICKKAYADVCDDRIIVSEDLYAAFLIHFYARTYKGIHGKLYAYNFGRGVTGGRRLNLTQFKNHATSLKIIKALLDFSDEKGLDTKHKEMIRNIKNQIIDDNLYKWYSQLSLSEAKAGYDLLIKNLTPSVVVSELAKRHWWEGSQMLDRLVNREKSIQTGRLVKNIGVYYHRMRNGGVERVLSKLLPMWKEMGYQLTLFTDEKATDEDYSIPEGIVRVVLPGIIESQGAKYKKRARYWEAMIKKYDIDTIVYNSAFCETILWDTCLIKGLDCNLVVETHSVFCGSMWYSPIFSSFLPRIYRMVDRVVSLSRVDATFWQNYAPTYCIPNPIDAVPETKISNLISQNIVWVGRLSAEKKPYQMLEAFSIVLKAVPDATLTIVGDGDSPEWMEGLQNYAMQHHIDHAVDFRGFELEVSEFYQNASILAITSLIEGFCLVLTEAMGHGLPTVMYDLPNLELVKENESIITVPQNDVYALANAMISLLNDIDKRQSMGKAARRKIEEFLRFDIKAAWREVFDSFINLPVYQPDENTKIMLDLLFENILRGVDAMQANMANNSGVCNANPQYEIVLNRHEEVVNRHEEVVNRHEEVVNRHEEVVNRHEEVVNRHEEVLNRHEKSINHQWEVQQWHEERIQKLEQKLGETLSIKGKIKKIFGVE